MIHVSGSKIKPTVRATYASCLATLAHTSSRILDMVQALRADGSIPTIDPETEDGVATDTAYQNLFDVARLDLVEHFESHTKALLTDSDASVRRAFLSSVSSLCVFFGSSKANDVVLSHLNTYLNDKDWILKCSFFQTIVGVATFVGGSSLEDFILPLMVQALTDPEEFVVERVLTSFASMAELGLFQRSKTWEVVDVVARFMIHPNIWIREAAVHYLSSATRFLSAADIHCIIMPLVQPYMKTPIQEFSETTLLDALKRPLPRAVLEMAATWAIKTEKGLFWRQLQQQRTFSFGGPDQAVPTISSKDLGRNALRKTPKNDEDEQWLTRLRNLGMDQDDEFKLLALRDYIGRMAQKRPKDVAGGVPSYLNGILSLEELKVTRQTIFFEDQKTQRQARRRFSYSGHQSDNNQKRPHTIADALLDASTTVNEPTSHRKKAYVKSRRERDSGEHTSLAMPIGLRGKSEFSSNVSSPMSSSPGTRDLSHYYALPPTTSTSKPSSFTPQTLASKTHLLDSMLSPTESLRTGLGGGMSHGVRHKSSAINLMNRRDTSKSTAETSTTTTNVVGQLDAPPTQEAQMVLPNASSGHSKGESSPLAQVSGVHSYDGNDPNVMKLLNNLASENFPTDVIDYGPLITPIHRARAIRKSDLQESEVPWRPQGILVATFSEHTGPINRVLPSPDHIFFITASDDGSVKVWDTLRLERNLVHRSRQTHKHAEGSKVKCVTFVENTHTFVSCASDGSMHIVKVDCTHVADTSKYGKLRLLRDYQLSDNEYAVWLEHFKSEAKSILLVATNTCRVIAFDLRAMDILYAFENPVHHGTPTCMCLDLKHNWLLLGTSHGILDLWDLRFCLHLKSFGIPGGSRIHRIRIHPSKGRGRWVCIAGGTGSSEITVWDLEKVQCREVYRASCKIEPTKDNLKLYEPCNVDDEKAESMLNQFANALDPMDHRNGSGHDSDIRALAIGLDFPDDDRDAKNGFFLTGGPDRKVRFWDIMRMEASTVVNGLDADEPRSRFITTHPITSLVLTIEQTPQNAISGALSTKREANSAAKRSSARPPRSTVISKQQQQLLRSHLDMILDVAFLEYPIGMTVSVDRAGIIYIFQ